MNIIMTIMGLITGRLIWDGINRALRQHDYWRGVVHATLFLASVAYLVAAIAGWIR